MNRKYFLIIVALLVVGGVFFLSEYTTIFLPREALEETSSYSNENGRFQCSRSINVTVRPNPNYNPFNSGPIPQSKEYGYPVDPDEAFLFCRSYLFTESEGILKILQRPEVLELISRYQYNEVSVKALKFELIKDEDFVNRLLPDYRDKEIGCIIIVETPGEKKVYLEDEKLQAFEELDYAVFNKYLNSVSASDRQLFLENLH